MDKDLERLLRNPRLDYLRARMIAYEFQQYQRRKPMQITMQGKYQTRDGRAVEIVRTNVRNKEFPVVGIITEFDGSETQDRWTAEGYYHSGPSNLDLEPVPTKHEGWCLVPSGLNLDGFETRVSTAVWRRDEMVAHAESHPSLNEHVAHVTWED